MTRPDPSISLTGAATFPGKNRPQGTTFPMSLKPMFSDPAFARSGFAGCGLAG